MGDNPKLAGKIILFVILALAWIALADSWPAIQKRLVRALDPLAEPAIKLNSPAGMPSFTATRELESFEGFVVIALGYIDRAVRSGLLWPWALCLIPTGITLLWIFTARINSPPDRY